MMWRLQPHVGAMLISLIVGVATVFRPIGWLIPLAVATALSIGQILSADLPGAQSARLYAEKLVLSYLACGLGFVAMRFFGP